MKSSTKQVLATVTVTSILSILIGGFAIWSSYKSQITMVDDKINTVITDVAYSPNEPITAALLSVEQNNFDMTIAFVAPTGETAILKESKNAILGTHKNLRTRQIQLQDGEKLIVAASISDISNSLENNLSKLLIFIIFANALASFISVQISRTGVLTFERAQREKMQEFLGDAAHELRTPLTVVKGYSELLESGKLEGEHSIVAFKRLNSEIKRMESLIGDLLILAELGEENGEEFTSVNLTQLLRDCIADFQVISPQRVIESHIDNGVTMNGSQKYLHQFIVNALVNIRNHTDSQALIKITLKNARIIGLTIEDGGGGLPESSYGEKIQGLKRFDRSRSRETGGSGLGLSIMSGVIERHKGVLNLRKSSLGGLAIDVQLPHI